MDMFCFLFTIFLSHDFGRTKEIIYKILVRLRNKDPIRVAPGGGGTPLYKLYRYVPPYRVGFLRRFGLKMSIHFAHFGLESGMVFEGNHQECMNVFIVSIPNEYERKVNMRIRNEFEEFFVCALITGSPSSL